MKPVIKIVSNGLCGYLYFPRYDFAKYAYKHPFRWSYSKIDRILNLIPEYNKIIK